MSKETREHLSCLVDGEINRETSQFLVRRLGSDEHTQLSEEDVILEDGDIVFIESRDTEVFYTGGLLGVRGGE